MVQKTSGILVHIRLHSHLYTTPPGTRVWKMMDSNASWFSFIGLFCLCTSICVYDESETQTVFILQAERCSVVWVKTSAPFVLHLLQPPTNINNWRSNNKNHPAEVLMRMIKRWVEMCITAPPEGEVGLQHELCMNVVREAGWC